MIKTNKVAIHCRGVSKKFGETHAVENVSLTLHEGQFMALLGPSGCGKTTTLRMLAGFEIPDSGEIEIASQMVNSPNLHIPPERRNVGMVFQEYALFPHMTVADNVAYGIPRGVDKKKQVHKTLRLVGLSGLKERMPYELSGGQQQRVALARALAPDPDLILLDEPFSNLDASLRRQVRSEIRQILHKARATAIFVTHDQEEALSLADKVAVMLRGKIVQADMPFKLYRRPATREIATFLGYANFLPGQANGQGQVSCELGSLITTPHNHTGAVEVMLRPEELSITYNENGAVTVIDREYFGHDQMLQLQLNSGTQLQCRSLGSVGDFCVGQRVNLSVRGEVVVYPV